MNLILSAHEKLSLVRNLGIMLSAGIPLLESIDSLMEESSKKQKKVLETLRKDISQGKKVSESLEKYPKAFDSVETSLLKSAEESGNLEQTLNNLAVKIEKDIEFSDKVKSALMYPVFVVVLFCGIFIMILTYVIPRIAKVFSNLKVVLPLPTKILIALSNLVMTYYLQIGVGFILLFILGYFLYKTQKRILISFILSLPFLSKLGVEMDLARITQGLHMLLKSGIPITQALELAENIAAKKEVSLGIAKARKYVTQGKTLTEGLTLSKKVFPNLFIRFINAGEKSGSIEETMEKLAYQYDLQVTNSLKAVTTLLEPIMLVVVGVMVGGIMLSIIAPIYQLIGNIKPR